MPPLDTFALQAGLDHVRSAPADLGEVRLLVRRPAVGEREVVSEAAFDALDGLVGDGWRARGNRHTSDGSADPAAQVTVMNVRCAELVAGDLERVPLAGDQVYVDFDIGTDNLPAGAVLAVGEVLLEVSAKPHLGCAKFVERFGADAMRFVNSRTGRRLRLRGVNTRVVRAGVVRVGDPVRRTVEGVELPA